MPKTLTSGSTGPEVKNLQTRLNQSPPSALPPLTVDGIFGPKTLARVKEYQRQKGLQVDGIVGPKTWGALGAGGGPGADKPPAPMEGTVCGTCDEANVGLGRSLAQRLLAALPTPGASSGSGGTSVIPSAYRFLTDAQKATARTAFGDSLDFSRIYLSDSTGAGGRPFTFAFPDGTTTAQIINCGTFSPGTKLLIHELTHVWQSQHHSDPYKFMKNSVDCQAGAATVNAALALSEPDLILHGDWPGFWPFSAYAYMPGFGLAAYAAEQMAQANELADTNVRNAIKGTAMNAVSSDNEKALKLTTYGDRRTPGVKS